MRVGISGCGGRMGRMLVAEVAGTAGCAVAGGIDAKGSAAVGQDLGALAGIGALGIAAGDDVARLLAACDVAIDFSVPAASAANAAAAARAKTPLVIGTTGLEPAHEAALREAAKAVPIVWAANMSLGVNLVQGLVRQVAATLGEEYDIEIVELHHRHKVDAPSGTALAFGRAAAEGRGIDLAAASLRGRDGITGARPKGAIGFASLRGGDVVGEHVVIFAADGERIELTHRATSRRIFARGAVRAARWAVGRPPGLYGMKDVLGLG
ncbi:MAG TPA: 4-hydroxy-tetrahydrodipicolinate reductase [Stellaceae bacterium]|nr:4-hydroxy-tetrahydrodipicolinate reductase [Stellaceae bacterium]